MLHQQGIGLAVPGGDFEQKSFSIAGPRLQVAHRVGGDQLALVDDEHLLAGLFDFRKDVGAENNGVIAGQAFDQVAGFVDLFGIQPRGGFVENQHVWIVNNRLRQTHPLAVAFGEFAQKLVLHIGHKATLAYIIHALFKFRAGKALELAHEAQVFGCLHLRIKRRSFGQIADSLLHLERLCENIEACDRRGAGGGRKEAGENAHGGCLPRAIGAKEANDLALFYGEGDVIDCNRARVPFCNVFDYDHRWEGVKPGLASTLQIHAQAVCQTTS